MRVIHTEIEIKTPPQTVWRIVSDLAAFTDWNPFITRASGVLREGAKLEVELSPPRMKPMTFRPTITKLDDGKELRWRGRVFLPGICDGEHIFRVERLGANKTRFIQAEDFRGLLVPLLGSTLDKAEQGFRRMNLALKEVAEVEAG